MFLCDKSVQDLGRIDGYYNKFDQHKEIKNRVKGVLRN